MLNYPDRKLSNLVSFDFFKFNQWYSLNDISEKHDDMKT